MFDTTDNFLAQQRHEEQIMLGFRLAHRVRAVHGQVTFQLALRWLTDNQEFHDISRPRLAAMAVAVARS